MSLTRACFIEGLAMESVKFKDSSVGFLTGMLSLIDVILGEEMHDAMEKLPLSNDIKSALISGDGILANLLNVTRAYETLNWKLAEEELALLEINEDKVPMIYERATQWANEQMKFILTTHH